MRHVCSRADRQRESEVDVAKKSRKRKLRPEAKKTGRNNAEAGRSECAMPEQQGDRPEVIDSIRVIEQLRGSRVIAYYLHDQAMMSDGAMPTLFSQLRALGRQPRIDLFLHSRGGVTVTAWRIVQAVRSFCDRFGVLVPYRAHSAATHVAIGADEIVMGPFSELGPVDPSRSHPLLPPGEDGKPVSISVQDLKHAMEFVKREAGTDGLSGEGFATVIAALFQHVHPLAVGAIEQSYEAAKLITRKVLSTHMDAEAEKQEIDRIAKSLADDFKEHTYQIGVREAKELGLKAEEAADDLHDAMWTLLEYYQGLDRTPRAVQLTAGTAPPGQPPEPAQRQQLLVTRIGHLDSTARRADCQAFFRQAADGSLEVAGDRWVLL